MCSVTQKLQLHLDGIADNKNFELTKILHVKPKSKLQI